MRKWGHVLLLGAILAVGAWFSLRDLNFFTSDTGLRYLQVRTFQELGWRHAAVPYTGLRFDPGMRFVPYYYAYSPYGDKLLLAISPFFPLLVAAFRSLLGSVGIVIVPVFGTLLAAGSVAGVWRLAGQRNEHRLLWATALATPLLFYTLTLWDHTLGVGLSTAGVYFAARGLPERRWIWPFGAGLMVAFAVAQRAESVPLVGALAVALLFTSRYRWFSIFFYGVGALVGLLVTVPFNILWVGHPLGIVLARSYLGYGRAAYYPVTPYEGVTITRAMTATRLLLNVEGGQIMTLVAALSLVAGGISLALLLRLPQLWRPSFLYLCLGLAAVGTILGLLPASGSPILGLLTTFPLFGLSLAYVDEEREDVSVYRLVFLTAWLFVGLTLVVARSYGGHQWGARYLLPSVPLLLFLAMYALVAYRGRMGPNSAHVLLRAGVILIALTILVQIAGARLLITEKQSQWQEQIGSLPVEIILTNNPFLASFLTTLEDKVFYYVEDEADVALLAQRMGNAGVDRITFVLVEALPLNVPERAGNVMLVQEAPLLYRLELTE